MSRLLSTGFLLKIIVLRLCVKLFYPVCVLECELHRRKLQSSISNKAHRLGTNVEKMDQIGWGRAWELSLRVRENGCEGGK